MHVCTLLQVPLVTLVGASNELPESEELDALYDRFLLRKEVKQVTAGGEPKVTAVHVLCCWLCFGMTNVLAMFCCCTIVLTMARGFLCNCEARLWCTQTSSSVQWASRGRCRSDRVTPFCADCAMPCRAMPRCAVCCDAGLTQMLDYYAGNSYDEEDSRPGSNGSSRGARSGEMQVGRPCQYLMPASPTLSIAQCVPSPSPLVWFPPTHVVLAVAPMCCWFSAAAQGQLQHHTYVTAACIASCCCTVCCTSTV